MTDFPEKEEHYLLRIQDQAASKKLRDLLNQSSAPATTPLELRFDNKEGADPQARTGSLVIQGESFPTKRLDLPTIAETFKTYDDCNLVKSADIGQIILVPPRDQELPEGVQARDGVTPPMRDACDRRFRKLKHVDPSLMRHAEEAILIIASGQAPEGYEFLDEEEEYVVAPNGRSGSWQPIKSSQPGQAEAPASAPQKKPSKRKLKKKAEADAQEGGSKDMEEI